MDKTAIQSLIDYIFEFETLDFIDWLAQHIGDKTPMEVDIDELYNEIKGEHIYLEAIHASVDLNGSIKLQVTPSDGTLTDFSNADDACKADLKIILSNLGNIKC
jgi:hypothetical protein